MISSAPLTSSTLVAVNTASDRQVAVVASPSGEVMDYAAYRTRVDHIKAFFEDAYRKEQDAAAAVAGVQKDLLLLLTDPVLKDRVDLQRAKQLELEEREWQFQNAAMFTAELRNEIKELAKQRDGDYTDEYKFSGIHTLDHCKPVPFRAEDISPQKRKLVKEAFPEVNPAYGVNHLDPDGRLTAEAFRELFAALDTQSNGYLTVRQLIRHLESKGCDFGLPDFAEKFVFKVLKDLKSPPVDGDKILFEQFRCIMLRWAAL